MAPTPPGPGSGRQFLREVEAQVVAGLVLTLVAGVSFLVIQLPRQLDAILANQKVMAERAAEITIRLGKAEQQIYAIDGRVTTLEAR